MSERILIGDCRQMLKTLPSNSVHCVVTSPPYWGLRSYLSDNHPLKQFEIGSEPTPDHYVAAMMEVFQEVHRVMRPDATLWLNIGDTFTSGGRRNYDRSETSSTSVTRNKAAGVGRPATPKHLKAKELVGIPWRVAFALQGFAVISIEELAGLCKAIDSRDFPALDAFRAGIKLYEAMANMNWFWHRLDIIWSKPNPTPESVTDRPTKAHEYLFLLSKSKHYFYDPEPIREPLQEHTFSTYGTQRKLSESAVEDLKFVKSHRMHASMKVRAPRLNEDGSIAGANKKSVWVVGAVPTKTHHTATFPPDLVRPCILAGTSEKGCCAQCGAPWLRIVKKGAPDLFWQRQSGGDVNGEYHGKALKNYEVQGAQNASNLKARILKGMKERKTVGWKPSCDCYKNGLTKDAVIPCTVLDPFAGIGTAGAQASKLGREFIGCELDPLSISLAQNATAQDSLNLLLK